MKKRAGVVIGLFGAIVALGFASVAWACTSFAMINLSAASGPANTEVSVQGSNAAANAPVTLRWNSRVGTPAAQATADAEGKFTVPVRVPDTGGVHFLVAIDGKGDVARGAFEVTSSATAGANAFNAAPSLSPSASDATVDPNQWLRVGAIGLGLGLMLMVPLAGMVVLARPRVPVRGKTPEA